VIKLHSSSNKNLNTASSHEASRKAEGSMWVLAANDMDSNSDITAAESEQYEHDM
jgi:hypothetical protein